MKLTIIPLILLLLFSICYFPCAYVYSCKSLSACELEFYFDVQALAML